MNTNTLTSTQVRALVRQAKAAPKQNTTFRLSTDLVVAVRGAAQKQGVSMTEYVEIALETALGLQSLLPTLPQKESKPLSPLQQSATAQEPTSLQYKTPVRPATALVQYKFCRMWPPDTQPKQLDPQDRFVIQLDRDEYTRPMIWSAANRLRNDEYPLKTIAQIKR